MGRRGPESERVLFVSEHFLDHPKIGVLTDGEFRTWMRILIEQLRNGGTSEVPQHAYGISRRRLERLIEVGLLDREGTRLHVHGWDKWNSREAYKRFLTRERVRRLRERRRSEM